MNVSFDLTRQERIVLFEALMAQLRVLGLQEEDQLDDALEQQRRASELVVASLVAQLESQMEELLQSTYKDQYAKAVVDVVAHS